MTGWQDITEDSPVRGESQERFIPRPNSRGGGGSSHREFHPNRVLVDFPDGVVRVSWWVPSEERWMFFSKKNPPTRWHPLPTSEHA